MRLLKNPTTKIGRERGEKSTHPTVSFLMFTV